MTAQQPQTAPNLPGYSWVQALGSGGFAEVHLYRQHVPSRNVAIKVARGSLDANGVRELQREANAMAAVAGHPAVVELYAVGTTDDGRPYLVMEYCPIANVGAQVRSRPMAVDRALDMIIRICGGVEMLHRSGLVHRDIKPGNIMIDSYGKPVLGDFGVASPLGALEEGVLDGFSVLWAPPEQQDPSTHAHPTQDVWALAATLWTLLIGRSPFEDPIGDNSAAGIMDRVRSGRMRAIGRADTPPELEQALRAAMTTNPSTRTRSAADLGRALQHVQEIMGRPVTPMELRDDVERPHVQPILGRPDTGADDGTRLRSMPSIDVDRTRLNTPAAVVPDAPSAAVGHFRESLADTHDPARGEADADEPRKRGVNLFAVIALVVVGAVITAGIVVAMLTGGGKVVVPSLANDAEDPSDFAETVAVPPAPVTDVSGEYADGKITWTWKGGKAVDADGTASQSQSGSSNVTGVTNAGKTASYLYTYSVPGKDDITKSTTQARAVVEAAPGENCIEVVAVGESGRQSNHTDACVTVP